MCASVFLISSLESFSVLHIIAHAKQTIEIKFYWSNCIMSLSEKKQRHPVLKGNFVSPIIVRPRPVIIFCHKDFLLRHHERTPLNLDANLCVTSVIHWDIDLCCLTNPLGSCITSLTYRDFHVTSLTY